MIKFCVNYAMISPTHNQILNDKILFFKDQTLSHKNKTHARIQSATLVFTYTTHPIYVALVVMKRCMYNVVKYNQAWLQHGCVCL